MKTLKQILNKNRQEYYGHQLEQDFTLEIKAVKEWLTQKRQEIDKLPRNPNAKNEHQIRLIDELLDSLESTSREELQEE